MDKKLNQNIYFLEYNFSKYHTLLALFISVFFLIFDSIYAQKIPALISLIRILPALTAYLIFFRENIRFDFHKIGKNSALLYLLHFILGNLFIAKYTLVPLVEFIMYLISFLFFFPLNKALLYCSSILLLYPVSYLYNYYMGNPVYLSPEYLVIRNYLHLACVFIVIVVQIYFLILYTNLKTLLRFIDENKINLDKLLWYKPNIYTNFSPKEMVSSTQLSSSEKLFYLIESHMKIEKPWLDPEYNIDKMARDLQTNTLYISQAVNLCAKINFKSYLNDYRLSSFIEEMKKERENNISLKDIYINTGFNNQATFNRVFKAKFNMTPQEYFEQNMT
jgi:AraC-like DNA-binding protein